MTKREAELLRAIGRGDVRAVDQALRAGASARASRGDCPVLVFAIDLGHLDIVRLLLEHGADPRSGGRVYDRTPLIAAVVRGQAAIVRLLLQWGVDPGWSRPGYASACALAALRGHAEVVSCLLAGGLAPDTRDTVGQTALHLAAREGQAEVVRVLLDAGADVDAVANQGMTPLACAVECESLEESGQIAPEARQRVVTLLLAAGADLRHRDDRGRSIEDLARQCRDDRVLALLRAAAAGNPRSGGLT